MWIATALISIAVGAILSFGVSDRVDGANLYEIGIIIMVVGVIGLLFAIFAEMADRRRTGDRDERRVVERERRL